MRLQQWRRWLAGSAGLVLVAGLGTAMARADGFSAASLALESGQLWVASSRVGQLGLLDGSTEQKVAQLTVARPGERIAVTQAGPDALVVNHTTGSLLRVKGSTYADDPGAVTPLTGAGAGLSVFAGPQQQAFAVDAERGVAVTLDRATMSPSGRAVSLAARLTPEATVMDQAGRLWAVDSANGDLVWFDRSGKHLRRGAARPGPGTRLTLVRGEPALVDPAARSVSLIDPASGEVAERSCLDVAAGAAVTAGGSSTAPLVFAVAPDRGVLLISDLAHETCSRVVTLAQPGAKLGAPVETGGRVFVPDYASGRVFVIDLDTDQIVGSKVVLDPGLPSFELQPRDGFVFYNDPQSERAGVIRLDGSVREISKYNPDNPSEQVRRPTRDTLAGQPSDGGNGDGTSNGSGENGSGEKGSGDEGSADSARPGKDKDQDQPQKNPDDPGQRPDQPQNGTRDPNGPPRNGSGTPSSQATLTLTAPPPYIAGDDVHLSVAPAQQGRRLTSASWTFGDQSDPGTGLAVTHTWASPGPYLVRVRGVFSDGTSGSVSSTITVSARGAPANQDPAAALTLDPSGQTQVGTEVTADASGSRDQDPGGSIVSYTFDWDDGTRETTTSPTATHTYATTCPACSVSVTVTDDQNGTGIATAPLDVQAPPRNQAPTAVLDVTPATGVETGAPVTASGSRSADPENDPLEYRFTWGDGGDSGWSARATDQHRYSQAGTWTVTLQVRAAGQPAALDATQQVEVVAADEKPTAALTVSPGSARGTVSFAVSADATGSRDDRDTGSLDYEFDWDDGTANTTTRSGGAYHIYTSTGTFDLTVTVTDSKGQTDTDRVTVQVEPPAVHQRSTVQPYTGNTFPSYDLDEAEPAFMNGRSDMTFDPQGGVGTVVFEDNTHVSKVGSASFDACNEAPKPVQQQLSDAVGDVLCVTTDEGRLAMVEILNQTDVRITTWEPPNSV